MEYDSTKYKVLKRLFQGKTIWEEKLKVKPG